MKICVLVPSDEYLSYAGVRIRYRRIEDDFRALGHDIDFLKITDFDAGKDLQNDIYIVSKCYSTHALLASDLLKTSGKSVGVDLFDDHFTQYHDSNLTRRRTWLRSLLSKMDFALCSTPAIREVVEEYSENLAVHIVNDPSGPIDESSIAAGVQDKLDYALQSGVLNVGWFGLGSNPDFPVGLSDLVAFGGELARLANPSFEVRLDILTDRRALSVDGLGLLRRLSVPYTLEEWREERERALLTRSLVCFLPVNGQNFSAAKSLNRAVSALAAGAQVFSSGYPLYEPLSPFVYRDPRQLLADIQSRSPAVRTETIPTLVELLVKLSSPMTEARRLADFLGKQVGRISPDRPLASRGTLAAVIHGADMDNDVHEFAQRAGILSVSSPFSTKDLNTDIRFAFSAEGSLEVLISDRHLPLIDPRVRAGVNPYRDGDRYRIPVSRLAPGFEPRGKALARLHSPMAIVAGYAPLMADLAKIMQVLFPGIACFFSDRIKLPVGITHYRDSLDRERQI